MINKSTFVAILTYNEESNISDCIDSIEHCSFENIYIFDGGSSDRTIKIAKDKKVVIEIIHNSSISVRRGLALKHAIVNNFEFVLFVDADQRLLDSTTPSKIEKIFMNESLLAGVQLNLVKPQEDIKLNYWQLGFYSRHSLITTNFSPKVVIGTPCFFRIKIVKDFQYNIGKILGPSDDTFFCKQITSAGFLLKSVDIKCTEIVRASLSSTIKKAYWYGIGDAEYIINENSNKNIRNHLYHVFIRNPIINPLKNANKLFLFYLIFGISRMCGFLYYYISRPKKYLTKS
jgi:glycosyltransferase involved in cell wall biosynthesis